MYHIQFGKNLSSSIFKQPWPFYISNTCRRFFPQTKPPWLRFLAGALDAAAKALGVNAGALLGALLAGQANPQTDPG